MSVQISLFDAIHTMRAMRRLKPDPVPDELIARISRRGCARRRAATCSIGDLSW